MCEQGFKDKLDMFRLTLFKQVRSDLNFLLLRNVSSYNLRPLCVLNRSSNVVSTQLPQQNAYQCLSFLM